MRSRVENDSKKKQIGPKVEPGGRRDRAGEPGMHIHIPLEKLFA